MIGPSTRFSLAAAIIAVLAAPAAAERIKVRVTEVAGGLAYIDAGRAAGIIRGTKIRFGRTTLSVVETTEKTASVDLGKETLSVGASGTAEVTPGAADQVQKLPPPRPPEAFKEQWPELALPADVQSPEAVPLGSGKPPGQAHVTMIGRGYATADRDGHAAQAEARLIASYDLMTERPLAADADVALRVFSAGTSDPARVPVFVRAAQLRYGDPYDPRLALGRLRYAASSVGMLDGVRASARLGTLELAGYGGIVPDPIDGKPDTMAARFGTEVAFDDPDGAWRPRVGVTASGSTWDGKLDERRLAVNASANRDDLHIDGWGEAQMFPSGNPWGAKAVELTGGGATGQWRSRGKRAGVDVTFLRPERSLRLAAALPPEWLCTRRPEAGDVPSERCTGGDSWVSGSAFAGLRGERFSVDAIGAIGRTNGVAIAYDATGYLAGELRLGPRRLLAGVSGGRASFARWVAGHVGAGMALSRMLDLVVRYRPELLDYAASTGPMLLHAVVVDAHVRVGTTLDVAVSASGTTGEDRDALALLTTVAWRPLP